MNESAERKSTLRQRITARREALSPAEQRVAEFFLHDREEVLIASASELAEKIGTSDATVVRAAQALGYDGLHELRRDLADELRASLSPAARLARTLDEVGDDLDSAFRTTLDTHRQSIERMLRDIPPPLFRSTVARFVAAQRVFVFGIGPSSAIANYFAIQLGRFGIESGSLTDTGLLLADGLHRLKPGDLLTILAYGHVYKEVEALLDRARTLDLPTVLITDSLGEALAGRVGTILPVARGRSDMLSMHTATLGLIEALLVGIASQRQAETIRHLRTLNDLRARIVGKPLDVPARLAAPRSASARRERKRRSR